jgi:hypothetical protein
VVDNVMCCYDEYVEVDAKQCCAVEMGINRDVVIVMYSEFVVVVVDSLCKDK